MKRQSFCTTNLTKMKPKPLFLDLRQSKKRKKGYNLEVLTGRRRGFDRKTSSFRQEDRLFLTRRHEDMIFWLTGSYETNLGGYGVPP